MCNLNILYKRNGKTDITSFLMSVSSHSYIRNNHADGIYISSSDKCITHKDKIDYYDFKTDIEKSKLVISHQRISTSGFEKEFNQPFSNKNFVLVHNGIINQFLDKNKGSDTFGFWTQFNKEFNSQNGNRQKRIIDILKELFKKDEGSYSILIYDKISKLSYYFKSNSTDINFYTNKDYLFITTEDDNKAFLSLLSKKDFIELKIEPRKIYLIDKLSSVFLLDNFPKVEQTKTETKIFNYYRDTWKDAREHAISTETTQDAREDANLQEFYSSYGKTRDIDGNISFNSDNFDYRI